MSEQVPSLVVSNDMLTASNSNSSEHEVTNTTQHSADLQTLEAQNALLSFWQDQLQQVQNMNANAFKVQVLPLARIKKIMKMDEDVKMISAEAPLLFAKAAEMFISELSLRAWVHTEESKRRTLQRNDIALAITKFDQFDFLIDIVPREEIKPTRRNNEEGKPGGDTTQYFYSFPQQSTQANNQASNPSTGQSNAVQANQVILTPAGQLLQINPGNQSVNGDSVQASHVVQLTQPPQQNQTQQQTNASNTMIITNNTQQQPQQQQGGSGIVVNTQNENQAATTNQLIQQIISNSGTSPSDIHSIQITADGQIQIIKTTQTTSENL